MGVKGVTGGEGKGGQAGPAGAIGATGPEGLEGKTGATGPEGKGGPKGVTKYVNYVATEEAPKSEQVFEPLATPDKLTFQLTEPTLVQIYIGLQAVGSGHASVEVLIDGTVAMNEGGSELGNEVSCTCRVMLQLLEGVQLGAREGAPEALMGVPFISWMTEGEHTVELRYRRGEARFGPKSFKERRLIAVVF
jgi:hypothetical protein